jgi:hypothetical protein
MIILLVLGVLALAVFLWVVKQDMDSDVPTDREVEEKRRELIKRDVLRGIK